ncbi:hypothetical protein J2S49_001499 [Arcanobacterium wilhelmae]|uniref:SURF1-like protein n=1 Tax=Arcanobacterium wilhelmae TaxID=1803177 RepID=A0ABT9ND32_9ACTO|nr:hypothetical protein [Arcanobacterium wilhelmae]MDP9801423.1 hypothetical protein [Arcanobacterium wilhelmae]WFN90758.1 hypothetical protein P8A24_02570 [Arcanobacterium wilhelmae]
MKILAYVLALLGFLPVALPSLAQDVPPVPDVISWFEDAGLAQAERQAPSLFGVAADGPTVITVGTPVRAFRFSGAGSTATVADTNNWVAPVSKNGVVVGSLEANFDDRKPKAIKVTADVRLGSAAGTRNIRLVSDPELEAWFALAGQTITPASKAGAEVVLGEISLQDFLINRGSLAGEKRRSSSTSIAETPQTGHSLLSKIAVGWGVGLLAVFSLAWLRWDQNNRERLEDMPQAVPAPEPLHEKPSFKDAAPKVAVYQLPRTHENLEKDNNDNSDD